MDWTESEYSQRTAMRLARAGAWVRIVAEDDACQVCQALSARIYTPSEVPRLPIRGCTHQQCRCRFEAVDPETELTVTQLVERGVQAFRAGRRNLAEQILRHAVSLDEMSELGWLWLSGVVEDSEKVSCLEKVLSINPRNKHAQAGLAALHKKGTAPLDPQNAPVDSRPVERSQQVVKEPVPTVSPPEPDRPVGKEPETADPPELGLLQAERKVIIEQWTEFIAFAVEIDPNMLLVQAQAFLQKLGRLNGQTLDLLVDHEIPTERTLAELQTQWQESDQIGEALARVIDDHRARDNGVANWQPMLDALHQLGSDVVEHRRQLREQIAAAGGQIEE